MIKRKSKIEKGLAQLFNELGTILFNNFDDLCMMLGMTDVSKVKREIKKLEKEHKVYLDFDGCWILDYIPF